MNNAPIHWAVDYELDDIIELLIAKGADINAKDIIYQIIKILFLINII